MACWRVMQAYSLDSVSFFRAIQFPIRDICVIRGSKSCV